ncbi:MAG: agmatine/peptidylarginine deiminase, partial [Nitrospinales bacterium]
MTDKPASLGYRMPAEWEPHSSVWLAWPHNLEYWSEGEIRELETLYSSMILALAGGETIDLLVNDGDRAKAAAQKLREDNIPLDRVNFHVIPTDDLWIRDYGPNFLVSESTSEKTAFNQWQFNAWGGKYAMPRDGRVAATLSAKLGIRTFRPNLVLEGGAIEVNGKGTCITTEQCLLNKNRNGGLARAEIEGYLKDYLGVEKIVWLQGGLEGDDTDGHIDN